VTCSYDGCPAYGRICLWEAVTVPVVKEMIMDDQLRALQRRVERAERLARTALGAGIVLVAGVLLLAFSTAGRTAGRGSTVQAPFQVVDEQGKVILQVDVEQLGDSRKTRRSRLQLNDDQGAEAFSVSAQQGSTATGIFQRGKPAVGLIADGDGGRVFVLDADGKPLPQPAMLIPSPPGAAPAALLRPDPGTTGRGAAPGSSARRRESGR
jgi:hypothetical protein